MAFREMDPLALDGNFIKMIGEEWMLIAAEHEGRTNMMTASWGAMGYFWRRPVAICVIRRERFTHPMVDAEGNFSLSFYDERYREQLNLCGSKSGRDIDKIEACGFTLLHEDGVPYFEQARLVLLCKKIAKQPLPAEAFLDPEIVPAHYKDGNFHDMFFGEITKALVKE